MSDHKQDVFGDFAVTPVPEEERRSTLGLFMVYSGVLVCIAVIWGGGALGRSLTFANMATAAIIGSVVLGIIGLLTGIIGGHSKVSSYVILRHPFGRIGSMIAGSVVSGIACGIGWFFIQAWLFGTVFSTIINELTGGVPFWASPPVASVWGAALMTLTAVFGYKGIALLSYLAVPMFLIAIGGGSSAAIIEAGGFGAVVRAVPAAPITLSAGVTAVVGMYIAGATITSDIARFSQKPASGGWAWFWHVLFIQPFLLLAGGMLTLLTPAGDVAQAMAYLGIGVGALVLVILGQWTTNDNNLYSGALAFSNTLRIKKSIITIILGAIGAVLASLTAAGVFGADPFISFLMLLGRFLPPIAGVLIADFYILKPLKFGKKIAERYTFGPGTRYCLFNLAGLVALVAAGILAPYVPGIVAINSVLLGLVFYLLISLVAPILKLNYELGSYVEGESGF